ncbi:MAG: alanine racemase [Oleiphilaceae bacterium]|nr:alanine racemase [Oleiphilaceae bacterium]
MPRPTLARVDLAALRYNYRLACQRTGSGQAMAVVKADGYGHGLAAVATALRDDAPCFAVACLEEALTIRQAGLTQPVVLLEGVHAPADLAVCAAQGFEPVLHHGQQVQWAMASRERPLVWLKLNTGMNRLGFPPAELPALMSQLTPAGFRVRGLMTHFACADDLESGFTVTQTRVFETAAAEFPELLLSAANSAAHFRPGQPLFDWSRPGIMLYGATPMLDATGMELGLKPVMSLESELISVRTLEPGMSVGYGARWVADKPTLMGVVAIGYGDGYPRHAGTGTPAAVKGIRVRLIGRVSMDMLAVDLSPVPDARPGDSVELWGSQVSVDEVADAAGTIGYELLTGVTPRVPRQYSE